MKFKTPKGTRDYIGEDGRKLQKLIDVVKSVYEKYGFEPWFTPAFETFELLSSKGGLGEAVKDEIYYFEDKAKRPLGLRFDLTMPLARIAASKPDMLKPIKRYAIAPVWRYDNPQAMRWREFWQADVDIIGSKETIADAEILAAVSDVLKKLGFDNFKIRVSNRKTLDDLLAFIPEEKKEDAFRIIDKKDKIGIEGVEAQLNDIGLDGKKIASIIYASEEQAFEMIKGKKGFDEIMKLYEYAESYGYLRNLQLDLSLVRGLDYYTGLVFEIDLGVGVSCGGGGRYDSLIGMLGGQDLPATGVSLGLNRILEVWNADIGKRIDVFIAVTNKSVMPKAIEIVQKLRSNEIKAEVDVSGKRLSNQLEYADKISVPWVVIVGEKEVEKGKYKLKNMKNRSEEEVSIEEIIEKVKG